MTQAPKITALAPWFGGKRSLASEIVRELGRHTQYFEPFCGSMAVLLAKPPSQKETVNDRHGDLINLARIVADQQWGPRLHERLQGTLFSEDLLRTAGAKLGDDSEISLLVHHEKSLTEYGLERAYWYFLASWMGRNGTAGTARLDYQLAVRWTASGGSPTVRFRNAVDSMPAWHRRLQNVVILCRDAFAILDRFEDVPQTAIYVDPPYLSDTRSKGAVRNGRGGKYLHEFDHTGELFGDDHSRLADVLHGYKQARVVVSYYDSPRIRDLYRGWTFVDHARQKHLHAQNGRGARKKEAPELLIINGPSYHQEA